MRNSLQRCVFAIVCIVALAGSALGQNNPTLRAKDGLAPMAIRGVERTVLYQDIAHYRFDVAVGPGKFDVIRMHRVAKSGGRSCPFRPMTQ